MGVSGVAGPGPRADWSVSSVACSQPGRPTRTRVLQPLLPAITNAIDCLLRYVTPTAIPSFQHHTCNGFRLKIGGGWCGGAGGGGVEEEKATLTHFDSVFLFIHADIEFPVNEFFISQFLEVHSLRVNGKMGVERPFHTLTVQLPSDGGGGGGGGGGGVETDLECVKRVHSIQARRCSYT